MFMFALFSIAFASPALTLGTGWLTFDVGPCFEEVAAPATTVDGGCYQVWAKSIIERGKLGNGPGHFISAEYIGTREMLDENRHSLVLSSGFQKAVIVVDDRAAKEFAYIAIGDGKTIGARVPKQDREYCKDDGGAFKIFVIALDQSECEPFPIGDSITVFYSPEKLKEIADAKAAAEAEAEKKAKALAQAKAEAEIAKLAKGTTIMAPVKATVKPKAPRVQGEMPDVAPSKTFDSDKWLIGIAASILGASVLAVVGLDSARTKNKTIKHPVKTFARITVSDHVKHASELAAANEAWWLVFPGARIAAFICSVVMAAITALVGIVSLVDEVASYASFIPHEKEWSYGAIIAVLFCLFVVMSLWFLRGAIYRAIVRSEVIRNDPRRVPLLQLTRGIAWWNKHLPVFNDFAEAGGGEAIIEQLHASRVQMIEWSEKMDKRLKVAGLGSFPAGSERMPIPEMKGLASLVMQLKAQAVSLNIRQDADDLGNPERSPSKLEYDFWMLVKDFLRVRRS